MPSMTSMPDLSSALRDAKRVTIVGIGSDVRGDDAAGVEVVRRLRAHLNSTKVQLIDAGVVPENFISQITRFEPSHVFLVDATDFSAEPGEVILAEPEAITGRTISTHTMPLSLLANYLRERIGAKVMLLGIQPGSARMGATMDERVKKTIESVEKILLKELSYL